MTLLCFGCMLINGVVKTNTLFSGCLGVGEEAKQEGKES